MWSAVPHRILAIQGRTVVPSEAREGLLLQEHHPSTALEKQQMLCWCPNVWDTSQVSLGFPGRSWYLLLWLFL